MDQDLINYLDAKFAGVDGKFADLRSDMNVKFAIADKNLAELRSDMNVGFLELREEMNANFSGMDAKFHEDLEKLETKLLTAFHQWASPMEGRVRTMTTVALNAEARLGMLEDRISAIERRLPL